jgi:chromosomal replication initiation ATPase DnaA
MVDIIEPSEAMKNIAELRARIAALEARSAALPALAPRDRLSTIVDLVVAEFGVPRDAVLSPTRRADVALARHVAMALAHRCLAYSMPRIGRLMDRDHTAVLHAVRRVARLAEQDETFAARVDALAARITSERRI